MAAFGCPPTDLPPPVERDFAGMYLGGWKLLAKGDEFLLPTASPLGQADAERRKDLFLAGIGIRQPG